MKKQSLRARIHFVLYSGEWSDYFHKWELKEIEEIIQEDWDEAIKENNLQKSQLLKEFQEIGKILIDCVEKILKIAEENQHPVAMNIAAMVATILYNMCSYRHLIPLIEMIKAYDEAFLADKETQNRTKICRQGLN